MQCLDPSELWLGDFGGQFDDPCLGEHPARPCPVSKLLYFSAVSPYPVKGSFAVR